MVDKKIDTGVETKTTSTRSTTKDAVAEAKKKAAAQVNAQRRRAAVTWIVVGVIVVGLLSALVAFIVREGAVSKVSGEGQLDLVVATENGGIPVGADGVVGENIDSTRVRMDLYFDFMCPACAAFEQTQSETVNSLREQGLVDVYYHPLGNLDYLSEGTAYSTRTASAAALVAAESPVEFLDFVEALFANQPAEGTEGLTDAQIQEIASHVGIADDVVARIPDREYASWVRVATVRAGEDGLPFTPTVAIDGVMQNPRDNPGDLDWTVEGALEQAIIERSAG